MHAAMAVIIVLINILQKIVLESITLKMTTKFLKLQEKILKWLKITVPILIMGKVINFLQVRCHKRIIASILKKILIRMKSQEKYLSLIDQTWLRNLTISVIFKTLTPDMEIQITKEVGE